MTQKNLFGKAMLSLGVLALGAVGYLWATAGDASFIMVVPPVEDALPASVGVAAGEPPYTLRVWVNEDEVYMYFPTELGFESGTFIIDPNAYGQGDQVEIKAFDANGTQVALRHVTK